LSLLANVLLHTRGDFFRRLVSIAIPISLQMLMLSSRGLVDVLMLGQLGEEEIAAVGVAARATFVSTIMLVGMSAGGALLSAQFWGAGDREGVRGSTALTWLMSMIFALFTVVLFVVFPSEIMATTTDSETVNKLGSQYLVITSFSMCAIACVNSMSVGLRAIHKPGISTFFSGIGIISNVILNWILIFGKLGFPALGIQGAALATLLSGAIEVGCLYGYIYSKKHLLAFGLTDLRNVLELSNVIRFLKLSLPTTFNFLAWSGGLFVYHAIMGQTGVQGLAALSVMTPVESISLSLLIGLSNAAAVLIGNQLGAKQYEAVYYQALGVISANFITAVFMSGLLYLAQIPILNSFSALTGETRALVEKFILILSLGIILRSIPMVAIVGVLRAGGDVRYCLGQDLVAQWLIGIPIAAVAAMYFNADPEWIYLLFLSEEVVKWIGCFFRVRSKKWMRNLIGS